MSGLDIVRKALGKHEIATVQTKSIDEAGLVRLTTVLPIIGRMVSTGRCDRRARPWRRAGWARRSLVPGAMPRSPGRPPKPAPIRPGGGIGQGRTGISR